MVKSKGAFLGVIALLIALGAAGLGVYQVFFTQPNTIVSEHEDAVTLIGSGWQTLPVNLTFNTRTNSLVLLEFSCLSKIDIIGGVTNIQIQFWIDGVAGASISEFGYSGEDSQDIYDACSIRDYVTDFTPGAHSVTVRAYIDDTSSTSFVSDNVLTVTIL